MQRDAVIDETRKYRYSLTRSWNPTLGRVAFILLNPSTANAFEDDSTVRRCIDFATRWGYGSIELVNLFAFRTKDPKILSSVRSPIGSDNDDYIKKAVVNADIVVVSWGENCVIWGKEHILSQRYKKVLKMLKELKIVPHHLGITRDGLIFPRFDRHSVKP